MISLMIRFLKPGDDGVLAVSSEGQEPLLSLIANVVSV
jgi:hypothetical protein